MFLRDTSCCFLAVAVQSICATLAGRAHHRISYLFFPSLLLNGGVNEQGPATQQWKVIKFRIQRAITKRWLSQLHTHDNRWTVQPLHPKSQTSIHVVEKQWNMNNEWEEKLGKEDALLKEKLLEKKKNPHFFSRTPNGIHWPGHSKLCLTTVISKHSALGRGARQWTRRSHTTSFSKGLDN